VISAQAQGDRKISRRQKRGEIQCLQNNAKDTSWTKERKILKGEESHTSGELTLIIGL